MILKCSCISLDHCKCLILINSNCGKGRKFPPIEQKFTYDQRNIRICKSASIDHKEMEKIKKGMKEKSKRINVLYAKVPSIQMLVVLMIMLKLRILMQKSLHYFLPKNWKAQICKWFWNVRCSWKFYFLTDEGFFTTSGLSKWHILYFWQSNRCYRIWRSLRHGNDEWYHFIYPSYIIPHTSLVINKSKNKWDRSLIQGTFYKMTMFLLLGVYISTAEKTIRYWSQYKIGKK